MRGTDLGHLPLPPQLPRRRVPAAGEGAGGGGGGTSARREARAKEKAQHPLASPGDSPRRGAGRHQPRHFPSSGGPANAPLRPAGLPLTGPREPPPLPLRAAASFLLPQRRHSPLLEPGLGLLPAPLELLREAMARPVSSEGQGRRLRAAGAGRAGGAAAASQSPPPEPRVRERPAATAAQHRAHHGPSRLPAGQPIAERPRERGGAFLSSDWRRGEEGGTAAGRARASEALPAAGVFERGNAGASGGFSRGFGRADGQSGRARREGAVTAALRDVS